MFLHLLNLWQQIF